MRLSALLLVAAAVAVPRAQGPAPTPAPAPAKGATVGFMHAIHATSNVETTLAFYRELFGLDAKVQPFANAGVPILTDSPGVSLRVAMLRIPGQGFNFELTEFTNTERRPAQPQVTDPGAPMMKFFVKDVEAVVAAAKKRGTPFITTGTAWVGDSVILRDPDGYLVAAIQRMGDAPVNVLGAEMGLTVADIDASMKFWRDMLGWEFEPVGSFVESDRVGLTAVMGLPKSVSVRGTRATIPGSTARLEMLQFRGVKGTPFDRRVPDPGASGIAIRVADITGLLPRLKAAGVRVVSKDGALVEWSPTVRNVFVKDPNGFLIELVGDVAR